jgi:hypothetical protein
MRYSGVIIVFALIVHIGCASASEGLIYAALFACDPAGFTDAYVSACSSAHVRLAARLADASDRWHARNREAAERSVAGCVAEIRKKSPDPDQADATLRLIRQRQVQLSEEFRVVANSEARCEELLQALESGAADVDRALK